MINFCRGYKTPHFVIESSWRVQGALSSKLNQGVPLAVAMLALRLQESSIYYYYIYIRSIHEGRFRIEKICICSCQAGKSGL